jgi:hypothetical protein
VGQRLLLVENEWDQQRRPQTPSTTRHVIVPGDTFRASRLQHRLASSSPPSRRLGTSPPRTGWRHPHPVPARAWGVRSPRSGIRVPSDGRGVPSGLTTRQRHRPLLQQLPFSKRGERREGNAGMASWWTGGCGSREGGGGGGDDGPTARAAHGSG